jgi:hypothetical protein
MMRSRRTDFNPFAASSFSNTALPMSLVHTAPPMASTKPLPSFNRKSDHQLKDGSWKSSSENAIEVITECLTFEDEDGIWLELWSDKIARVAARQESDMVYEGLFQILDRVQRGKDGVDVGRRPKKKEPAAPTSSKAEDKAFALQQKRFGGQMQHALEAYLSQELGAYGGGHLRYVWVCERSECHQCSSSRPVRYRGGD